MGIVSTSTITCDGCAETMTGDTPFVVLQPQSNVEAPFITASIVVCSIKCLQEHANSLGA